MNQNYSSGTFAVFCFLFSFLVSEANTSHKIGMRNACVEGIEVSSFLRCMSMIIILAYLKKINHVGFSKIRL